jgi:transcriptional regulator with XRE-family HTH domain
MVEYASTMKEAILDLNDRIAARVGDLRAQRGLSLDALATRSGVSRSMISLIERGESSATAVVLQKLASGLGVGLLALFDAPSEDGEAASGPVVRREDQLEWRDPGSGYVRRHISPPGVEQPQRIVEITFPAGARVAFEGAPRGLHHQIWLLSGAIDITHGKDRYNLREGDCLAVSVVGTMMYHNPTKKPARYVVVQVNPTFNGR